MNYIARIKENQEVTLHTEDYFDKYPDLVVGWQVQELSEQEAIFIKNCKLPKRINGVFVDAYIEIIEVPKEISRMKFKIQIERSTIYSYDIILEYIKNMVINEDFTQDKKNELIYRLEDAVSFNRHHQDFINLANMLSVPDEIKDEIFIEGNKID